MTAERLPARLASVVTALLMALIASTAIAPGARGADRVYWSSWGINKISYANLDGSGGVQSLSTGSATVDAPTGVAIDPVAGRVYWANHDGPGAISWANLDGSGGEDLNTGSATVSGPTGVAVDVAARKIFWANEGSPKISWASLDGSGGGDLDTGTATVAEANGIAVYPAAGRVYWTNSGIVYGSISYANLGGGGAGTLPIPDQYMEHPFGLAIDAAAGRIYWPLDLVPGRIESANLDGSDPRELDLRGLNVAGPYGLALDPAEGKVYFASTQGNAVGFARMDGTGGAYLPFHPAPASGVSFPALLETPRGTGAPSISRQAKRLVLKSRPPIVGVSSELSCGSGTWAGDLDEAFLYRAPQSFSYGWLSEAGAVPGAAGQSLHVSGAGVYRCVETATNRAGSTAQTSAPVTALGFGVSKRGVVSVDVQSPGTLTLSGKGVKRVVVSRTGVASLKAKPTGKKLKRLRRTGRVRLKPTLRYAPTAGPAVSESLSVELLRRHRR